MRTPGRWFADREGCGCCWNVFAASSAGPSVWLFSGLEATESDAELAAAAPDLVECVRYAVESLDISGDVRAMFEAALVLAKADA